MSKQIFSTETFPGGVRVESALVCSVPEKSPLWVRHGFYIIQN